MTLDYPGGPTSSGNDTYKGEKRRSVKKGAGTGARQPQAKGSLELPEPAGSRNGAPGGGRALQNLGFRPLILILAF